MYEFNFNRLPRAAQRYIEKIEWDLANLKRNYKAIGSSEPTNLEVAGLYMPSFARARFKLGEWDYQHIDVRIDSGRLDINAGRLLSITPYAANHITLEVVE